MWEMRSSGLLRSEWWKFLTDVSGHPIGPIFRVQVSSSNFAAEAWSHAKLKIVSILATQMFINTKEFLNTNGDTCRTAHLQELPATCLVPFSSGFVLTCFSLLHKGITLLRICVPPFAAHYMSYAVTITVMNIVTSYNVAYNPVFRCTFSSNQIKNTFCCFVPLRANSYMFQSLSRPL